MITKLDEYRVEIFKIAGFAMTAPFGRLFFEPIAVFNECGIILFVFYIFIATVLSIAGIILILKGYDILEYQERKR